MKWTRFPQPTYLLSNQHAGWRNTVPVAFAVCSTYPEGRGFGEVAMVDPADERLDRMIEIADELDVPLDHVVARIGRCDQMEFLRVSGNPSLLPRYTQSSVNP